jgi:hypothetical protein
MGAESSIRMLGSGISQPFQIMKFTLVYEGDLPATASSPKPAEVGRIRNELHDQLADLWESHIIFRQLARTARVPVHGKKNLGGVGLVDILPAYEGPVRPVNPGFVDLCGPIQVGGSIGYVPIVRKSLHLVCSIDILFLRNEEPGSLVFQGGDLDNRIKCLFDALRVPSDDEFARSGIVPTADPLYCLLEQDTLISDFSVKTGRILGSRTKKPHAVRLWMDVTVKVLRVTEQNMCLLSD